jgi:hypothetical protein
MVLTDAKHDCWDGVKHRQIYSAYPSKGRVEYPDACEAIGEAAEWIAANRPDLGDPLAFLMKRVKAYAKSDEGQGGYMPKIANWMRKRKFNDEDDGWKNRGDKPRQATREEIDRVMAETEALNERLSRRNGQGTGAAIH